MRKYLFFILVFVSCAKINFPWDSRTLEEALVDNNQFIMVDFYATW